MKVVIGLSGGVDSTVLLGSLVDNDEVDEIHCCLFRYGAKHGDHELKAANDVIEYYQTKSKKSIVKHDIDLTSVMGSFTSALLISSDEPIPEGAYDKENMAATVVPGRNLIFASIMAGLAESVEASFIALGIHQGDHNIFPDCTPEFVVFLDCVVRASTGCKVRINAPFKHVSKKDILVKGNRLSIPAPYHLTRSCYKEQSDSCGKCGTCIERIEAFEAVNLVDPIKYEEINKGE